MEAKFVGKAKLTKQGQLTMPQDARKDLNIKPESEVYWYELDGILVLLKELVAPKDLINFILRRKKR